MICGPWFCPAMPRPPHETCTVINGGMQQFTELPGKCSWHMAPRRTIIDTDPVHCSSHCLRQAPWIDWLFNREWMTFWQCCWLFQHYQRRFKCYSFPWHTAILMSKTAYAMSSHCSTMWKRRSRGDKALGGAPDSKLCGNRSLLLLWALSICSLIIRWWLISFVCQNAAWAWREAHIVYRWTRWAWWNPLERMYTFEVESIFWLN